MPRPSPLSRTHTQMELLKEKLHIQQAEIARLISENAALRQKVSTPKPPRQRLETIRVVKFSIDRDHRFTFTSPNIKRYTNLEPKQIRGKSLMDFIHPNDILRFKSHCLAIDSEIPGTIALRLVASDGNHLWIKISMTPLMEGSTYTGIQGIFFEINQTGSVKVLPAVVEQKYRKILANLREGFFEADTTGRITYCNKAMSRISGCAFEDLVGSQFQMAASPSTSRAVRVILARMYKARQKHTVFNLKVQKKTGPSVAIEFSVYLISNDQGVPTGFQGLLRDVSEQMHALEKHERIQAQTNHSRKMNALETLAGGVAHGFNNLLMTIQGNLSLIRMRLPKDHPAHNNLERINQASEKGGHLAREILSFAKLGKFVVMPTNLNKIIRSTLRMFARAHPHLNIHERLGDKLWQTRVDRVQIGQALLSLYANALDAMPHGGDLYLQSENTTLSRSDTQPYEAKAGPYVKISIIDSGVGLADEAKERIFEPFYSAYRPGQHNSLGLAAAYGTIRSHQGIIKVYSKQGHGATFTFYLPAEPADGKTKPVAVDKAKGVETILLVDDDDLCAQTCRQILERIGYHVLIAASGSEAIELYRHYQDQINLVLLDVILPDISGDQIFQQLKRCNPNATVIVISGYQVDQQVSSLLAQGCVDFLQKPFPNKTLANKVRAALDRKAVPPGIAELIS